MDRYSEMLKAAMDRGEPLDAIAQDFRIPAGQVITPQ
jgi:hypothetical protein